MGTLGRRMDRATAALATRNMLSELCLMHVAFDIDNIIVAGSLRRGKQDDIGDIDIILVTLDGQIHPQFAEYLKNQFGFTIDAAGSRLVRSLTAQGIQFDFYSCLEDQLPFMLAYLTGPQDFNIGMRSQARKLGYKLNQIGLVDSKSGALIRGIQTEAQLFHALGCNYIEPENRTNWFKNFRDYQLK